MINKQRYKLTVAYSISNFDEILYCTHPKYITFVSELTCDMSSGMLDVACSLQSSQQ